MFFAKNNLIEINQIKKRLMTTEYQIEEKLIHQLRELKYSYNPDIVDRKTLEQNFKKKFEALNRVNLSDNEFLSFITRQIGKR